MRTPLRRLPREKRDHRTSDWPVPDRHTSLLPVLLLCDFAGGFPEKAEGGFHSESRAVSGQRMPALMSSSARDQKENKANLCFVTAAVAESQAPSEAQGTGFPLSDWFPVHVSDLRGNIAVLIDKNEHLRRFQRRPHKGSDWHRQESPKPCRNIATSPWTLRSFHKHRRTLRRTRWRRFGLDLLYHDFHGLGGYAGSLELYCLMSSKPIDCRLCQTHIVAVCSDE